MTTIVAVFILSLDAPASGAARLRLQGHLDDTAAREVLHAAADVVKCGCSRLVVDLDGLTGYDDDAAFAVTGCTRLARWLPQGVDVVADTDAGRELAAQAGVEAVAEVLGGTSSDATSDIPAASADTMASCPDF